MENWKKNKLYFIITSIIVILPMIAGVLLWEQLPDRVATHFGRDNIPNGWSSKGFAVFGLPLFCLAVHVICTVATLFSTEQKNLSNRIIRIILFICPAVSLICGFSIYGYALSYPINMEVLIGLFVGIIFVVIGNYLPKCRQNYVVGIKIPWTLSDKENWNHTHRLAGWIWVPCGIIFILNAFLHLLSSWMYFVLFAVMIFVPVIYSFVYFLKQKKEER